MKQLTLIADTPRPPTPRQQTVLDAITTDGITAAEAGAIVHAAQGRHDAGTRCDWCRTAGMDILKALRKKGHVRQSRKLKAWLRVGDPVKARADFGELPEGF